MNFLHICQLPAYPTLAYLFLSVLSTGVARIISKQAWPVCSFLRLRQRTQLIVIFLSYGFNSLVLLLNTANGAKQQLQYKQLSIVRDRLLVGPSD